VPLQSQCGCLWLFWQLQGGCLRCLCSHSVGACGAATVAVWVPPVPLQSQFGCLRCLCSRIVGAFDASVVAVWVPAVPLQSQCGCLWCLCAQGDF